jgi:hypothetical protein
MRDPGMDGCGYYRHPKVGDICLKRRWERIASEKSPSICRLGTDNITFLSLKFAQ